MDVKSVVLIALAVAGFIACGSRTKLPFDETEEIAASDAGGTSDGSTGDDDALPPLDAAHADANRTGCVDPGATQIYLITSDTSDLLAFYPPQGTFKVIGHVACPTVANAKPFSMAVDRTGVAYVLFENQSGVGSPDGHIFRVSTATAACTPTSFEPNQLGFQSFGMGFSTNAGGPSETLFVARNANGGGVPTLGSIDTTTLRLSTLGDFNPKIAQIELTGTGDGRLFAFYASRTGASDSFVGQLDKTTAGVSAQDRINIPQRNGWAFGFWGGDFYLFTVAADGSTVTKFDPVSKATSVLGSYPALITGAGVSTCAPQ